MQCEVLAASEAYCLGEFVEGRVVSADDGRRADGVSVAVSVYVSVAVVCEGRMCAPWVCSSMEKVHSDACSSCLAAAAPFGCVFVVFAKAYERGDSFLSQHARATE